jgi:hypothetical protein
MEYSQIATASLDQLTDELAAAGWESGYSNEEDARKAVRKLFADFGKADTRAIEVTWLDGVLVAVCDEEHTLSSSVVCWEDPITEHTDAWSIAYAVTRINGAEVESVEQGNESVTVNVFV